MVSSFKNDLVIKSIYGGFLVQEEDCETNWDFKNVTKNSLILEDIKFLEFGNIITKYLKSNAIALIFKEEESFTLAGAGMGNPNRLISIQQAIEKAMNNGFSPSECTLISDAFFPFKDNIILAHEHGITKVLQPGGSIRDDEVIEACNAKDISMCFTGRRHFRH